VDDDPQHVHAVRDPGTSAARHWSDSARSCRPCARAPVDIGDRPLPCRRSRTVRQSTPVPLNVNVTLALRDRSPPGSRPTPPSRAGRFLSDAYGCRAQSSRSCRTSPRPRVDGGSLLCRGEFRSACSGYGPTRGLVSAATRACAPAWCAGSRSSNGCMSTGSSSSRAPRSGDLEPRGRSRPCRAAVVRTPRHSVCSRPASSFESPVASPDAR
jgi:hypothetical protein